MNTVQSQWWHITTGSLKTNHEAQRGHICWEWPRQIIAICLEADNILAIAEQCIEAARELIIAHIQTL